MFHKIKTVAPLSNYCLSVQFLEGCTKLYNVAPLFEKIPVFAQLKNADLFSEVQTDIGGYGIIWNENIDLSCEELWENGVTIDTNDARLIRIAAQRLEKFDSTKALSGEELYSKLGTTKDDSDNCGKVGIE